MSRTYYRTHALNKAENNTPLFFRPENSREKKRLGLKTPDNNVALLTTNQ